MATIAEILEWQPVRLGAVADALAHRRLLLLELRDVLDRGGVPRSWAGRAARAAEERHRAILVEVDDLLTGVSAAARTLDVAAEAVGNARALVLRALELAGGNGFVVDRASGEVTEVGPVILAGHELADRRRLRVEIRDHLEQARAAAEHADVELARALDRVTAEATGPARGDHPGGRALLHPPREGSPADHAAWFAGLTVSERDQVVARHPGWVGNTDGIPAWARHRANVNLIGHHRRGLERRLVAAPPPPSPLDLGDWLGWRAAWGHLQNKLDGLAAIEALLAEHPDRRLLAVEVDGSHQLKAVVAVGDVDTAGHVSVLTPGLGSSVVDGLAGHDRALEGLVGQADGFGDVDDDGVPDSAAGVVWLGYEAPQLDETLLDRDRSVIGDGPARAGAAELARFYNGLDAARDEDPRLTAVGYSYGSLPTGLALRRSTGVDAAVFLGSPGLGTDDLRDLDVPDGQVFHLEARLDAVGDLALFGRDPSLLDGMRQLSTDGHVDASGRVWAGVTGHSGYFVAGSTSQLNVAAVVAGAHDQLVDSTRAPGLHERFIDAGRSWLSDRRVG